MQKKRASTETALKQAEEDGTNVLQAPDLHIP